MYVCMCSIWKGFVFIFVVDLYQTEHHLQKVSILEESIHPKNKKLETNKWFQKTKKSEATSGSKKLKRGDRKGSLCFD